MKVYFNDKLRKATRIYAWYNEHGYIEIPGYYEKEYDNHCFLCGYENRNGLREPCDDCKIRYERDKKDKNFPMGIDEMEYEDWRVFHAIAYQIQRGEQPYATLEEYIEELKDYKKCLRQYYEEEKMKETAHRENSILYQRK